MRHVFISRLMMGSVLVAWSVLAVANRFAARATLRYFRRRGRNIRTAAIIGTGRLSQKLCDALRRNIWTGIVPEYFIDDSCGSELMDLEVLGPLGAIDEIISTRCVDIAFVAMSGKRNGELGEVLDSLLHLNVDVRVVPDLLSFQFLRCDVAQLDDIPIIAMTHSPQHGFNSVAKRLFDVAASSAAILVLAVPMAIIALAVKLTSRGPAFYLQERTSIGGRPFKIMKFRTMIADAEAGTGPVWAARDDPRVTRVGRLLRRTSLDELPQLFNVLLGHMSLVGPRPERPELIDGFRKDIPRYMLRHHVKAGLTGWAQVNGLRGNTSLRKRVQYDLHYIMNWSVGLDLRILFTSLFGRLVHANAY
jgi:Undecaprenyl-phosphate glucose phosphotransferase